MSPPTPRSRRRCGTRTRCLRLRASRPNPWSNRRWSWRGRPGRPDQPRANVPAVGFEPTTFRASTGRSTNRARRAWRGPQGCRTPHELPAEQPRTPVTCSPYVRGRGIEPRVSASQMRRVNQLPRPGLPGQPAKICRRPGLSYAIHCEVLNHQSRRPKSGDRRGDTIRTCDARVWSPLL